MNTRGNDRLRHMLAAEYALGTLRGPARRRFETWSRDDPELRAMALEWSEYLAAFTDRIAPAPPPRRVWEAIEARLPGGSIARSPLATSPWWDRLAVWRGLTVAFAAMATLALGLAMRPQAVVAPPPVAQALPQAVATISDPKSGHPVAFVMASERGDALIVKIASDVDIPAGKDLQLWVAPNDVKEMVSMGLVPASAKTTAFRVVGPSDVGMLAKAAAFGLSLEPAGGSKQPTQVLGLGNVMRVSS